MKKLIILTVTIVLNSTVLFAKAPANQPQAITTLNSAHLTQIKDDFLKFKATSEVFSYAMPSDMSERYERLVANQIITQNYKGWSAPTGIDSKKLSGQFGDDFVVLESKLGATSAATVQNFILKKTLTVYSIEMAFVVGACSQLALFDYQAKEILLTSSCWSE